jgi:hypothetical protein
MPKVQPNFKKAVDLEHRKVSATIDRLVGVPTGRLYSEQHQETMRNVTRATRGRYDVTLASRKHVAAAVGTHASKMGASMANEVRSSTRQTGIESLHSMNQFMSKIKGPFLNDDEMRKIVQRRLLGLERARVESAVSVHADIIANVQNIAMTAEAESMSELLDLVDAGLDYQFWRVERMVNTETAAAYNIVRADAIKEMGDDIPGGMHERWTEKVDDATGRPMDKRVGDDSLVLHGQLANAEGLFVMPLSAPRMGRTASSMAGMAWSYPPNRPHDRAILIPWWKNCGAPAWMMKGQRRVDMQ